MRLVPLSVDSAGQFQGLLVTALSLGEFTAEAFAAFGLDWQQHVVPDPQFARPTDINVSVGRPARARERLNWEAKVRMREIVRRLAAEESGRADSNSGEL